MFSQNIRISDEGGTARVGKHNVLTQKRTIIFVEVELIKGTLFMGYLILLLEHRI